MPAKKQAKNAFFFYMVEVQAEMLRKSGRKIPMKDMPAVAGPRWSAMTEAERAPYTHRAKVEKKGMSGVVREGRMDNQGELLSERRDVMLEMEERRETERIEVKQSIKKGRDAILQEFFFIDFQYLVDLPEDQADFQYQPVEVSLAKYSIEAGIVETLHRFIDPGPIPLGFRFLCQEHSDKTHKLPIEGFELAEDNYRLLLADVEHFINPNKQQRRPPIYAMRRSAPMCECCLQWIAEQAGVLCDIPICEAEVLFKFLDENIDPSSSMTMFSAEKRLGSEAWDHTPGIRCPQHQRLDTQHCTLATVKRYCFVISEDLCQKYAVSITESHLPPDEPLVGSIITYGGIQKPRGVNRPPKVLSASSSPPSVGRGRSRAPAHAPVPVGQAAGRGRGALSFAEVRQPRGGDALSQYPQPTATPRTNYQESQLLPQATPTAVGGAWAGQSNTSTHLFGTMQGVPPEAMYHHGNSAVYHRNVVDPRTARSSLSNTGRSDQDVTAPQSKRPPPGFSSPVHVTQGQPRPPGPAPSPQPSLYGAAKLGVRPPMSYASALGGQTTPHPPTR